MKKRLDILICEQNEEISRQRARTLIMSGVVYVNNQKELKAGTMFPEDAAIEIRGDTLKYVSRGGLKLEKALSVFRLDLDGKICMDIGSSTGGFTDCMLQNGAKRVYAVDVGKGQLHYKLRNDERVVVMEKTNIRNVTPEMIADKINFVSVDVSFISLTLAIPVALTLLDDNKEMVMLIKPQFEAGREKVGKKGVVRDPQVHEEIIGRIADFVLDTGLSVAGLTYSPVKGPEGNIEYLIYVKQGGPGLDLATIEQVVEKAHKELDK
ncbi:MAG: TlyA family RNA methyltransferase [Lachnospiraceae bacterium]|jgi:23S rRNA (cytidine1920-2'-O)/16S rRNA (cytidine1409-2'-O)-methyltransferase